jgi:hypothetical protein
VAILYLGRLLRDLDDNTLHRLISARSPQSVNDNNGSGIQHMPVSGTIESSHQPEPSIGPLLDLNSPEQGQQVNLNDSEIVGSGSENGAFQQASHDAPYSELWYNGNPLDPFGSNSMADPFAMRTPGSQSQLFSSPVDLYRINSASPSQLDPLLSRGGQQEVDIQSGEDTPSRPETRTYSLHVPADIAEHLYV